MIMMSIILFNKDDILYLKEIYICSKKYIIL